MIKFDQNTLVFVAASITLILAFLIAYLKSISKQIKGPIYWSVSNVFISIGLFTFVLHPYLGDFLTFVAGGSCATLGISLYLAGLKKFRNQLINKWIIIGFPLIDFMQGSFFTLIIPSENIRMINYSVINIILSIILILEFNKIGTKNFKKIANVGKIVFIMYGITMIIRIFSTIVLSPESAADETIGNQALFYVTTVSIILMAFVLIGLFNIKLSEELKEQVQNRDRFFSIISHDLTGPVGTIAEMLKIINNTDLFNKERQTKLLSELEKLSTSTWLLLQNLLEWSKNKIKTTTIIKKTFNLTDLVNQNVQLLAQSAKSKMIDLENDTNAPIHCFADSMMVDTVLRNLISNAIKFTPQKGKIILSCKADEKYAYVNIQDNGVGISEEKIEQFENNNQLSSSIGTEGEKGAGLGLMLCKDFIEKNNGKLQVLTSSEKGTTISIILPLELNI